MTGPWLAAAAWFSLCAVPLTWTDITTRRLPDKLTFPAYAGTMILFAGAAAVTSRWDLLIRAFIGGLALAGFYLLLALLLPRGMGLGDAKLAASLGSLLGWRDLSVVLTATLLAFLLAAAYGSLLVITRKASTDRAIPFGPFMILGVIPALLLPG